LVRAGLLPHQIFIKVQCENGTMQGRFIGLFLKVAIHVHCVT